MQQKQYSPKRRFLQQYIREAKRFPKLDEMTERIIIRQVKAGKPAAIRKLVNSNLMFVIKIAYKYQNSGMDLEDTISAGNLGLIEAAQRMDPEKKNKFITYAVWWIRQSIRHAMFNEARLIRIASNKEEKLRQLYKHQIPVKSYVGGVSLNWEGLAERLNTTVKELMPIVRHSEAPVSFEAPIGANDSGKLSDTLASDSPTPYNDYENKELVMMVREVSKSLNHRESNVIKHYFGLRDNKNLSMGQIGEAVNLSKERVRQIKEEALVKLKVALKERFEYELAA